MSHDTGRKTKGRRWWMGSRQLKRHTGFLFQVAWLRVDTQTILTIANHVITKNHRIGVTHSEHKTWLLHIRDVRENDRGNYMCQINTDPMKSQIGYLEVVGSFADSASRVELISRQKNPKTAFASMKKKSIFFCKIFAFNSKIELQE